MAVGAEVERSLSQLKGLEIAMSPGPSPSRLVLRDWTDHPAWLVNSPLVYQPGSTGTVDKRGGFQKKIMRRRSLALAGRIFEHYSREGLGCMCERPDGLSLTYATVSHLKARDAKAAARR